MSVAQYTQEDIALLEVFEQALNGARERVVAEGLDLPFSLPDLDPSLSVPERWENIEKWIASVEKYRAQGFRS